MQYANPEDKPPSLCSKVLLQQLLAQNNASTVGKRAELIERWRAVRRLKRASQAFEEAMAK